MDKDMTDGIYDNYNNDKDTDKDANKEVKAKTAEIEKDGDGLDKLPEEEVDEIGKEEEEKEERQDTIVSGRILATPS